MDIRFSKGICAFSSPWPHPGLVYEEEPWPLLFTVKDLLEEVRVKEGNERGGRPGRGVPGEEAGAEGWLELHKAPVSPDPGKEEK